MDLLATMYNAKTREVLADYNRVRNDVSPIHMNIKTHSCPIYVDMLKM